MFEKIVVAIDGSSFSQAATNAAGELAPKAGASVQVVHFYEHDFIPSKAGMAPDLETPGEARAIVAAATEQLLAKGVEADGTVLSASTRDVPRKIIEFADEAGADLIVVGRRGISSLTVMLVGSVSNELIRSAKMSVMVAH